MQEVSFSQNKFHKIKDNRENIYESMPKTTSRDMSLVSSQVKSEKEIKEQIKMRVQIKNQIKNMDLDKQIIDDKFVSKKELDLKKKIY